MTRARGARPFAESVVEDAALAWLESLGYTILHGREIAPGEADARISVAAECVIVLASRWLLGRLD
jgi:type I restriction enzyme R subunit